MSNNEFELTLRSDAFNALKADFDMTLRELLESMERKEADRGDITIKLSVILMKEFVVDPNATEYESAREITRPRFDHKVSSVFQYKNEKAGKLAGNFELVWTGEYYAVRELFDGQESLF